MNEAVSPGALSTLFTDARTHNGWRETPVSDETLREIYALMKWGPTSANCSPARIVFIRTAEGKERLRPALSSGNLQKTLTAPVTAIVAWDSEFYERLPQLFPHGDARSWFTSSPQLAEETAFRNSSMQAAYLIVACRALGLDTGPMSGFDRQHVDDAFFAGSTLKSNLLINIGYGDYAVVGHALGALVGMQLALDYPASVTVLISVNGWLRINAHTRRCFQVRERLLYSGGAQAWVEAQPLFLYPADWMAARAPRLEAEDALALAHFQGKNNLLRRLNALKRADFSHHADRIRCPVQIICASDDLLVPSACSSELHAALPDSQKMVMPYGGHACNVTDPETFNALLLNGLASLLHHREAAL